MNLLELIKYLLDPKLLRTLYQERGINRDSEALLIYLSESLSLNSEVEIFAIEETEDNLVFEKDGVRYIQLFPLDYTLDLINFDLDLIGKGYSDLEIAKRLLNYRERDT
ncbi:MAG: hypothetical protein BGO52_00605 [Sphingobacteriales bacterium 44-61]|uniref:hypothetical protein n=1 Tax=uncultured Dysgonomonas sp. TaxID=206096 RepID=UPI0009627993|nr:hypothetical protein [uncultured Dysgonomonas sp.]OJW02648.1 MAG: hypothetical protein BGO52_00605 [Sphingobacteriales bacterium 44-61]